MFTPPTPPQDFSQENILNSISMEDISILVDSTDINDDINLYSDSGDCEGFSCTSAHCNGHVCLKHECTSFSCGTFDDKTPPKPDENPDENP